MEWTETRTTTYVHRTELDRADQRQLLRQNGAWRAVRSFSAFDAPVYGELIARFLRGEFGVNEVDPGGSLRATGRRPAADPGVDRRRQSRDRWRLFERASSVRNYRWRAARPPRAVDSRPRNSVTTACAPISLPRRAVRLHRTKAHGGPRGRRPHLPARQAGHPRGSLDLQRRVREVYFAAAAKDDSLRVVDCSDPSGAMGSPEHNFDKIRARAGPDTRRAMRKTRTFKIVANVCRLILACTFIVSGFTKVIDPWGTALKVNEYLSIYGIDYLQPGATCVGADDGPYCFRVRIRLISAVSMVFFYAADQQSAYAHPSRTAGASARR